MRPNATQLSAQDYKMMLKEIGNLNRRGMQHANDGDLSTAFLRIDAGLSLARVLDKKCIEAKLLNSLGILYTMDHQWDKALLTYDQAMKIVNEYYGKENILYQTLGKNIAYLLT